MAGSGSKSGCKSIIVSIVVGMVCVQCVRICSAILDMHGNRWPPGFRSLSRSLDLRTLDFVRREPFRQLVGECRILCCRFGFLNGSKCSGGGQIDGGEIAAVSHFVCRSAVALSPEPLGSTRPGAFTASHLISFDCFQTATAEQYSAHAPVARGAKESRAL